MPNEKVAAIVPALNEEASIEGVLKVLLSSKILSQVILVDDGSLDKTAEIGQKLGADVIKLKQIGGSGKGNAIKQGLKATDAETIVFFDADLVDLTCEHIACLTQPVLANEAIMCVGIRNRPLSLRESIVKLDSMLAISGARAVRRSLIDKIPDKYFNGFAMETALNYYCSMNNLSIKYVLLNKLNHIVKERKWGILNGFVSRIKMIFEIIKIRLIFIFYRNEFIQKNKIRQRT